MNQPTKPIKEMFKSDNFCYRKVKRVITKCGPNAKISWKNKQFESAPKITSHFGCTNIIFVDSRY